MPEQNVAGQAREIFRSVFDMSPDSIVLADSSGVILLCNRKACEISGYTYEELIGRNSLDSMAPEELPRFFEELKEISVTGELRDRVYTYLKKDGTRIPVEFTVRWFEDFPGLGPCSLTIGRDISTRLRSETASRTLLENIFHGILVFQDAVLVYANRPAIQSLGFTTEELRNFSRDELIQFIHPDDLPFIRQTMLPLLDENRPAGNYHFRIFDKAGQLHWVELSALNIIYRDKPALQISMLDITHRKIMESELQQSLQRYQALAESSPDAIYIINRDEIHTYANRKAAQMMGLKPEEIIGYPRTKLFPRDVATNLYQTRRKVFETGEALQIEDQVPTCDGVQWFNSWFVPLQDETGRVVEVMGIGRNIESQKKAEKYLQSAKEELEQRVAERTSELLASREQLKHLAKMVVTTQEDDRRRVARELHNDAGQSLIILQLELASLRDELVARTPEVDLHLAKIMSLVDKTTNRIRDLSHSLHPPLLEIAGINLGLEDYCSEFATRTRIPVTYTGADIPGLPEEIGITLYRVLQEALTNIEKHAEATRVLVTLERQSSQVCLKVQDNGRCFDIQRPTTGTGLADMKERLALLGGTLDLETAPGHGTCLTACITWEEQP